MWGKNECAEKGGKRWSWPALPRRKKAGRSRKRRETWRLRRGFMNRYFGPEVFREHAMASAHSPGTARKPRRAARDPLDHVIWHIGRTYYAYIGLLERVLAVTGLDRHLRPGMGPVLF